MQNKSLNANQLLGQICERLGLAGLPSGWAESSGGISAKGSAVLFLITPHQTRPDRHPEPCLLLNKRSAKVLQPGDLCCPGGGVERIDRWLAPLMFWPMSPLRRWPLWKKWRRDHPRTADELATLLTAGLREGWEEMRLNPLKVRFLGCLPVQQLVMFDRHIYPLVVHVGKHCNLVPNWEVERIIHIPLRRLMDRENYARYSLSSHTRQGVSRRWEYFPCFVHQGRNGREVLWGATFRIAMDFMRIVLGFELAGMDQTPVINRRLARTYLSGSGQRG